MYKHKMVTVLFEGWRLLQHSYGTVLAFTLVHLWKLYGPNGIFKKNGIIFYIREKEYFRKEWEKTKKLVYTKEYNSILLDMQEYNGEKVDLIYRHTYPYDINLTNEIKNVPVCVFYTSEFSWLDNSFFQIEYPPDIGPELKDEYIKTFLKQYSNIHFVCPSKWSSGGMDMFLESKRNRIITHGVDLNFFYKHDNDNVRNRIRKDFNIQKDDILMINIGAMTTNKGIVIVLQALNYIVNTLCKKNYKLVLKSTGDLYQCSEFLNTYLSHLPQSNVENLKKYIIFLDKTLSYEKLNDLFNACDLYVSPYLAEGFGLTMLEALAAGLKVLVPSTGSTVDYIDYVENHCGKNSIYKVDSSITVNDKGMYQNSINLNSVIDVLISNEESFKKVDNHYSQMVEYIQLEYSWYNVAQKIYNHFLDLVYL